MENMDLLPPTAPSLVFARETYTPYETVEATRRGTCHVLPADWATPLNGFGCGHISMCTLSLNASGNHPNTPSFRGS